VLFAALQSTALEGVEKLINAALKYDPASARDLAALEGQIILVESSMPLLSIALEPTVNGIMLHSNWQDSASITITAPSLLSLAWRLILPTQSRCPALASILVAI
jgi:ubiquinone biosynthesis protein UbiJ